MKKHIRKLFIISLFVFALVCCGCGGTGDVPSDDGMSNILNHDTVEEADSYDDYGKFFDSDAEDDSATAKGEKNKTDAENNKNSDNSPTKYNSGDNKKTSADKTKTHTCTISIDCKSVLAHYDDLSKGKQAVFPKNGVILKSTTVEFENGDTVFDILLKVTKANKIQMEYSSSGSNGTAYIEGINNLYELDCGELSGWMFSVNGVLPNYGCGEYEVDNGDVVKFRYTCDLGRDL